MKLKQHLSMLAMAAGSLLALPAVADQALAQLHALETCPDMTQLVNILHHGGRA